MSKLWLKYSDWADLEKYIWMHTHIHYRGFPFLIDIDVYRYWCKHRFMRQASCPLVLCSMVLSVSNASSMASRARIWGSRMSGPASLFLFTASAFASACLRIVPVPYMAPVTTDFGIEIRSPLQDSNSWITSSNLLPSLTVLTYMDRSSAKAAWFHWGVLLMPCVIPVASTSRRSAFRNRSKSRGERTEPCTLPVSSCMGAEHPVPTVILIHGLLYSSSRKSTSGTPPELWGLPRGRSVLPSWKRF